MQVETLDRELSRFIIQVVRVNRYTLGAQYQENENMKRKQE